jgi:uncharacterized repeat protein (TIGR02543 family)
MMRIVLSSIILVVLLLSACGTPVTTPTPPVTFHLSITVTPVGAGSVSPSSGDYQQGDKINIKATPSAGYTFTQWSGDSGSIADVNAASTTITMNGNYTITANFASPIITIALDYYGIRNTHWVSQIGGDQQAKIQLVVSVLDDQHNLATLAIPQEGIPGFGMDFFQVNALSDNMDPKVWTGTATGSLTVYVAAYNVNKGPITKAEIDAISIWTGVDWSPLKALIQDKELVGYYWHTWSPSENWGIGYNYDNLTDPNADLRVWLRVGSDQTMPEPIQRPVLNPDVKIVDLTLPSNAKVGGGWPICTPNYPTTFRLENKESCNIDVYWEGNSSVDGVYYDTGSRTVPAKGSLDITTVPWCYTTAGPYTITYTIYWSWRGDNRELDMKSGTMVVSP